jgi:hypothetical protein
MSFKPVLVLAAILCLPLPSAAFLVDVPPHVAVEFLNTVTGHYVLIRDPAEAAAIDAGAAGPGWKRTGYAFGVGLPWEGVRDGNTCRFYSPSSNSHFHTAFAAECEALRANPASGWIFEKFDFFTFVPYRNCEVVFPPTFPDFIRMHPVYRLYNGGRAGDHTHRYTAFLEVRDEMLAQGWVSEGIAFCTASALRTGRQFLITADKIAPTAECEDERLNLGSCVALNQLPRLSNKVQRFLPPWYVESNPSYPQGEADVTGSPGHDLFTAYSAADPAGILSHSFVTSLGGDSWFGIHVTSVDRTAGDLASINPLYQFTTTAPATGQQDARVFPWGDRRDNHLEIAFTLKVTTLVRNNPQSHAYGHPTLQLVDRTSGQHLYITLGTYGSTPVGGEDYLAYDVGTGRVIVSTTFRANPSFGKRLSGEWISCPGNGPCDTATTEHFRFRIDHAGFRTALGRARTLAPTLSGDPADYFLANFHFNNEVARDGRIGLMLYDLVLEIFER